MSHQKTIFEARRGLPMVISLLALLLIPAVAFAFTYSVTQNSKMMVGSSRHVQMAGTYTLTTGELSLTRVQIVTLDRSGHFLSSAVGSKTGSTWMTGVGDFALVSYYTEFTVSTATGTVTYRTPTYNW